MTTQEKKTIPKRWIKCPSCENVFKWAYTDKTPREPVVDPSLPIEERRKIYSKRHRDKNNK